MGMWSLGLGKMGFENLYVYENETQKPKNMKMEFDLWEWDLQKDLN